MQMYLIFLLVLYKYTLDVYSHIYIYVMKYCRWKIAKNTFSVLTQLLEKIQVLKQCGYWWLGWLYFCISMEFCFLGTPHNPKCTVIAFAFPSYAWHPDLMSLILILTFSLLLEILVKKLLIFSTY